MSNFEVYKSGGTSTGTAEGYKNLLRLFQNKRTIQKVLVVSAPATETDRVTQLLRRKWKGEDTTSQIIRLFESISLPLEINFVKEDLESDISKARTEDELLALGEHYQAQLITHFLNRNGITAQWIDAGDVIRIKKKGERNIVDSVEIKCFENPNISTFVIGGFYGKDEGSGEVLTLPSGGSDLTGDVIAASLDAIVYENLKEVQGIFAASPEFVNNAHCLEEITYREIRELAYGGVQVLQEEAMSWCRRAKVPIVVRSLLHPENHGTRVVFERDYTKMPIVGIAGKKGFTVLKVIRDKRDTFFPELFSFFSRWGISIDMVGTEESIVTVAFENEQVKREDIETLFSREFKLDNSYPNLALVSLVGEGITDPLSVRARVLELLDKEVIASYGPILGGMHTGTTIYHVEKFGMNSERGYLQCLSDLFLETRIPIIGISTTIDSISVGTHMHRTREEIEKMSAFIMKRMMPDVISVTRNGLLYQGSRMAISNITFAVQECSIGKIVNRMYEEFF